MPEKFTKMIGIKVTPEQHRCFVSWEDGAEYIRLCIDTRFSGSVEEMESRKNVLVRKRAEMDMEIRELDMVIQSTKEADESIDFQKVRAKYLGNKIFDREWEQQVGWLTGQFSWSSTRAKEFLAWVNDDRGGGADD